MARNNILSDICRQRDWDPDIIDDKLSYLNYNFLDTEILKRTYPHDNYAIIYDKPYMSQRMKWNGYNKYGYEDSGIRIIQGVLTYKTLEEAEKEFKEIRKFNVDWYNIFICQY